MTVSSPARIRRIQRYQQVIELHQRGLSFRAIARRLGLHRSTVERFVRAQTFPERTGRKYRRGTDRFLEFLQCRWQAGCRIAIQLTQELREHGFTGSYDSVRRLVAKWRVRKPQRADPLSVKHRHKTCTIHQPSSKQISFWILRQTAPLEPDEQLFLDTLANQALEVSQAAKLSREFQRLLRDRQSQHFESWLERASGSHSPREIRRFAKGLCNDLPAVRAAMTLPWSNGPVEGQVNRLKLIKRQMYGRAKFDLLRQRVLHAG